MRPEVEAEHLLAITRSKAKMFEFGLPEEEHITLRKSPEGLLDLTIGMLGDAAGLQQVAMHNGEELSLLFSAEYFDSLLNCRITGITKDYLKLLGACAYYLSGYPGSALVLVKGIESVNLEANALEKMILLILTGQTIDPNVIATNNPYARQLSDLASRVLEYRENGTGYSELQEAAQSLKKEARRNGSDRELLLADLIAALCWKYTENSLWKALPAFSDLDVTLWRSYIQSNPDITELWPAQLLLGEKGVLRGQSAVIQMPTSAGKTKASELIIRSAMLGGRSNLCIVIAPYRALCQEIYNSMLRSFGDSPLVHVSLASDVLQLDLDEESATFEILILTPEKLDYLLRYTPDIAEHIGLIVYDEGHLFDDEARGVRYELLLTSLKTGISPKTQVVLISAVMPNAKDVGEWLIGQSCVPVEATHLIPTTRSIAFVRWRERARGRLEFVSRTNPNTQEFYVPRMLIQETLELRGREWKQQVFPRRHNGSYDPYHIAISLGCRLAPNGSVAIFTGRKDSASKIAEEFVDVHARGAHLEPPMRHVDDNEVTKLYNYVKATLGQNSIQARSAELGAFIHHGSTPHGLRLAIEFAIQNLHANFVICTSTLAQGVNLPIRYLVVTTDRQGKAAIKTRDFHNLMGRAGRAGMYTEGTILFADPRIYDGKSIREEMWRWRRAVSLLDPQASEHCLSHILTYFDNKPVDKKEMQLWQSNRERIHAEIENYLLRAFSMIDEEQDLDAFTNQLVTNTLAYYQADDTMRVKLNDLFKEIAHDIYHQEPRVDRRAVFAKAVLSIEASQQILATLENIAGEIAEQTDESGLFDLLWPIIAEHSEALPTSISKDMLYHACNLWLRGYDFPTILAALASCRFGNRIPTVDHVVYLCENVFGFQGSSIVGSCFTLIGLLLPEEQIEIEHFTNLQKRLRYGLPDKLSVALYEMGFHDRQLAQTIASTFETQSKRLTRTQILRNLHQQRQEITSHITEYYPAYFSKVFGQLIIGEEK